MTDACLPLQASVRRWRRESSERSSTSAGPDDVPSWRSASPRRPRGGSPSACSGAAGQLTPSRSAVAPSAAKQAPAAERGMAGTLFSNTNCEPRGRQNQSTAFNSVAAMRLAKWESRGIRAKEATDGRAAAIPAVQADGSRKGTTIASTWLGRRGTSTCVAPGRIASCALGMRSTVLIARSMLMKSLSPIRMRVGAPIA